jgi:hypothetical protein
LDVCIVKCVPNVFFFFFFFFFFLPSRTLPPGECVFLVFLCGSAALALARGTWATVGGRASLVVISAALALRSLLFFRGSWGQIENGAPFGFDAWIAFGIRIASVGWPVYHYTHKHLRENTWWSLTFVFIAEALLYVLWMFQTVNPGEYVMLPRFVRVGECSQEFRVCVTLCVCIAMQIFGLCGFAILMRLLSPTTARAEYPPSIPERQLLLLPREKARQMVGGWVGGYE